MNSDFRKYLEKKPESSYSPQVLKEIKLLSYNKNDLAQAFGSYIYRIQKYPGDIDLVDAVYECNTVNGLKPCTSKSQLISNFAFAIKKIVKDIVELKSHYYSEIKAGLDKRYIFDIGNMEYGIFTPNMDFLNKIDSLYNSELLNDNEYDTIISILKNNVINGNGFDTINNILRERYILRWNVHEILQGFKMLPGKKRIELNKALEMNTLCKIDMITLINGRFIEMTNVYGLGYYDKELILLNNTADATTLPLEIEKLYYSNKYYSPFKLVKRIFAYCRHQYLDPTIINKLPYEQILEKIIPFVSSNVSLLYQIKSELDTIILILEKFKDPSPESIIKQLGEIKNRLSTILEISDDDLNYLLDQINFYYLIKSTKNDIKIDTLESITYVLKKYINVLTIDYLNSVGMNPPPFIILPSKKLKEYIDINGMKPNPLLKRYNVQTYNWNLVRERI